MDDRSTMCTCEITDIHPSINPSHRKILLHPTSNTHDTHAYTHAYVVRTLRVGVKKRPADLHTNIFLATCIRTPIHRHPPSQQQQQQHHHHHQQQQPLHRKHQWARLEGRVRATLALTHPTTRLNKWTSPSCCGAACAVARTRTT